jgi:hypothetical protein
MSDQNIHHNNIERASYEFGRLLRSLPDTLDLPTASITHEQKKQLIAADCHAAEYTNTLLNGLESMGRVIYSASLNTRQTLEMSDVAQVGILVTELAVQLQFLDEFRSAVAGRNLFAAVEGSQK